MNVLLVAPDCGLQGALNEVRAVALALHPVPLNGTVTRKDLLDALGGHVWDIIWFATHGDQNGIMLSDGAVSIADLTAIARNSGAYLVVLNSCSSRYVGMEIYYELGVDVITTEAAADDMSAYQTGAFLARNLASGLSVVDAYERSKPGQNALYHLFSAHDKGEQDHLRVIKMLNEIKNQITMEVNAGFSEVKKQIGDMQSEHVALNERMVKQETATEMLKNRNTPLIHWVMILLMTAVLMAMFGLTLYQQFMEAS